MTALSQPASCAFVQPPYPTPRQRFVMVVEDVGDREWRCSIIERFTPEGPADPELHEQRPASMILLADEPPCPAHSRLLPQERITRAELQALGTERFSFHRRFISPMSTFEPFRQLRSGRWRDYALVSTRYTATEVVDLTSGEILASDRPQVRALEAAGRFDPSFCPAEFLVPDWWEVHHGWPLLGDEDFEEGSHDLPAGLLGFVAGCQWGDDSFSKLQALDLSGIAEGVLARDDRFGYLELPHRPLAECLTWPQESPAHLRITASISLETVSGHLAPWSRDWLTRRSGDTSAAPSEAPV